MGSTAEQIQHSIKKNSRIGNTQRKQLNMVETCGRVRTPIHKDKSNGNNKDKRKDE